MPRYWRRWYGDADNRGGAVVLAVLEESYFNLISACIDYFN